MTTTSKTQREIKAGDIIVAHWDCGFYKGITITRNDLVYVYEVTGINNHQIINLVVLAHGIIINMSLASKMFDVLQIEQTEK